MAELRTEEEQIAALKEWWKNNGSNLLIAVGLAVAVSFGWKAYQNSELNTKSEASALYEQLVTAATATNQAADESNGVSYLAGQLKDEFGGTEYAVYAGLFLAKEHVQAEKFDAAIAELEWVLGNTEDIRMQDLVNARIARLLSAQGKHDDALARLSAKGESFKGEFLELSGDIHLRKQQAQQALVAYKAAYALVKDEPQSQPLLAVKLANLGVDVEQL